MTVQFTGTRSTKRMIPKYYAIDMKEGIYTYIYTVKNENKKGSTKEKYGIYKGKIMWYLQ